MRRVSKKVEAAEAYLLGEEGGDDDRADPTARASTAHTLGRLLLEAALTPALRQKLSSRDSLGVLVEAPSPGWVAPLRQALNSLGSWDHVESRDGTARFKRKPDDGAAELTGMLAAGRRVAVVCHAAGQHVPAAFIAAADIRIRPAFPTEDIVRAAIEAVTGSAPSELPDAVGRLDLGDLEAAIRERSSAAQCVRRLTAACSHRFGVQDDAGEIPHVSELKGYGLAGEWANRLVEDVNAWRRDPASMGWGDLDAAVVLGGPPGVGKTSLVASTAKSCGLKCITTSVANWFSGTGHLDSVIKNMHAVFDEALASAPCILFFDEADAIPNRASLDSRHIDYWAPLMGALLERLSEAAAPKSRIVLIAATNHPDRLDRALVRPGRLGRIIDVTPPDAAGLQGILRQHLRGELADADLGGVAAAGVGATGAVAASWIKGARRTARLAGRPLELVDLLDQVLPPDDRSDEAIWRCAVHESGHAVLSHILKIGALRRVSIVSAGRMGGHTVTELPSEPTLSKAGLQGLAMVALGGRAAEEILGLGHSTGAHDDLRQATSIAAAIRVSFGLGGSLLHRAPMNSAAGLLAGDEELRKSVGRDLERLYYGRTLALAREHVGLIEALARLLVEVRVVEGPDFLRLAQAHERALAAAGGANEGGPCNG
jgi:cell division protease FtsH